MKKKTLNLIYFATYASLCIAFLGCDQQDFTKQTGASGNSASKSAIQTETFTVSGNSVQEDSSLSPEEISLTGYIPEFFLYNSVDNTLAIITRQGQVYTLYTLLKGTGWEKYASWKCKEHEVLDTFAYASDGALYCFRKNFQKKELKKQELVKCKKDGNFQTIQLQKLGSTEVTDIRFSGTALALTYKNQRVKFYNIAEKLALGSSSIKGLTGTNLFHDYHYITQETSKDSDSPLLTDYDIRSGEVNRSFSLETPAETEDFPIHLTNYRKKLYLLTPAGLYTGTCDDSSLLRQAGWEDMQISSPDALCYFQAARDNTLYYAWKDDRQKLHLLQGTVPEKKTIDFLSQL